MADRAKLKVPKKYQGKRLWSFSRVHEFETCKYSYYLHRILKVPSHSNIFFFLGTMAHDTLEQYYEGKATNEQMIDIFEESFIKMQTNGFRFAKEDADNKKMMNKYYSCMKHFFYNFKPVDRKVIREKEIYIDVKGNIFLGYIDQLHKDTEGNLIITDDKTSTIYTGKKIDQEKAQLILYGLGLIQMGLPIDKIKLRWHFLKYISVSFKQKNGKIKTVKAERWNWINNIESNLKMVLKDKGHSPEEITSIIQMAKELNSLEMLPKEIQDLYTLDNCYVEIPFNQEIIDELIERLDRDCNIIIAKENQKDINEFERDKIKDSDSYYCTVLCSYNNSCKYYKQYLNEINTFRNEGQEETGMYEEENKGVTKTLDDEIAEMLDML